MENPFSWQNMKKERTEHYLDHIHGHKLRKCVACNGSGYYDHNGSPPCGGCDGTGQERYPGPKSRKYDGEI